MKQVFAIGGRVVVADVPEPTLGPGEVLVAPAFSVVSTGTETLAIQIARAAGLDVLGLDVADRRVELARKLGATAAINPDETDPFSTVFDLTDGVGLDAVLLCVATTSSEPLNRAFDLCRQRGCV